MSQKLEGLWLGGEISREAAEEVQSAIEYHLELNEIYTDHRRIPDKVRAELYDLANAIRAQIQKLPKPMSDLV